MVTPSLRKTTLQDALVHFPPREFIRNLTAAFLAMFAYIPSNDYGFSSKIGLKGLLNCTRGGVEIDLFILHLLTSSYFLDCSESLATPFMIMLYVALLLIADCHVLHCVPISRFGSKERRGDELIQAMQTFSWQGTLP